jgi:hypothetical protein
MKSTTPLLDKMFREYEHKRRLAVKCDAQRHELNDATLYWIPKLMGAWGMTEMEACSHCMRIKEEMKGIFYYEQKTEPGEYESWKGKVKLDEMTRTKHGLFVEVDNSPQW